MICQLSEKKMLFLLHEKLGAKVILIYPSCLSLQFMS